MNKFVKLGGSDNPVAYCAYHKFTLSKNQLKAKGCLEKNCNRLIKKKHPYWDSINKNKAKSKQLREEKKIKNKELEKSIDTDRLFKKLKYCVNAPCKLSDEIDYCSQCPANKDCMSGIISDAYEYFSKYIVK